MQRKLAKDLLLSNNYWVLNKNVVGILGIETAFLLSVFADAESMLSDEEGWFYQTIEKTEKITTLSRYKQEKSIKELLSEGILEQRNQGIPMKRYFRINYDVFATKYAKNSQTELQKTNKLDCEILATNKEHIYKESNINKIQQQSVSVKTNPAIRKDKSITYSQEFEQFYSIYPNPFNKQQTYKNYQRVIKDGISHQEIMLATREYISELKRTEKLGSSYVTRSSNFVGQKADYLGYLERAKKKEMPVKPIEIVF